MAKWAVGDRVKVKDRPGWPGGYKVAHWEGRVIEVKDDPRHYVVMLADSTGYPMGFHEDELEKA